MNSLILITAMTATTGLFGGKHCGQPKHHAKRAVSSCYSAAPSSCYSAAPCGTTYAMPYATHQGMAAPSAQGYPTAPTKMAPPVNAIPTAPPVAPPMPTPSSSLTPATQPAVATGDNR
jgi:hypothetical protein